jgi:hypothetical protein
MISLGPLRQWRGKVWLGVVGSELAWRVMLRGVAEVCRVQERRVYGLPWRGLAWRGLVRSARVWRGKAGLDEAR